MNGRKTGWLGRMGRRGARVSLLVGLAGMMMLVSGLAGPREVRAADKDASSKANVGPGFSQAILATQLALQGEKRKSPILMLAAAELIRDLKQIGRSAKETHFEGEAAGSDKGILQLSVAELADKAKAYARGNKDLAALVEKRAEQLTSRGLDPSVGEKLPSVKIKDITYKILGGGTVPADGSATMKNIPFVAGKVACIAAIGENSTANLAIEVRDESGQLIQNPPSIDSKFLTVWVPSQAQTVNVRVRNNGEEQKVAILANWD